MFLAYSPCRLRYFWRIWRRLRINKTTLKLPFSLCTLKDLWRTYRILLNTFGIFSDYGKSLLAYFRNTHKGLRICRSKFAPLTMPADFKGTYRNNWMRPYILYWPIKNNLHFLSLVFKSNLLFGYMENTLKGKKVLKFSMYRLIIEHETIFDPLFLP